jgi:cell division protein FtsW
MKMQRNHIDLTTFLAVLILMVMSLGVVYSASSTYALARLGGSGKLFGSHALKVLLGFAAIFVFMQIDYRIYKKITKPVLLGGVALLLVTVALGGEVKGASRWLRLGGFGLQPSEFVKYALVFHLCTLVAEKKDRMKDFKAGFLPMLIWIGGVTVLVLAQPNFSTGAMIFAISMVILYLGRAKLWHIALSVGGLVPLLAVYMMSAPYRKDRILNFIGGAGASAGGNYQSHQAIIGFGNGGLFGLGPGGSRQRDLWLPESYGDFVFSIVGEEYGLLGTLLIVGLFLTIMLRGMKIARHAPDEFGRMLAAGITATITLYALINAGVTLGILPTTGLPMPFVSYGGSSLLFTSMAVGVLLNISMQSDLHPRVTGAPEGVRPVEPVRPQGAGKLY